MTSESAQLFFEEFIGNKASQFTVLAQSGSARQNVLAENHFQKFIITSNENLEENEAFFYFSKVFSDLNLNTPKILRISDDRKLYIQEFLGNQTLSEIIEAEGLTENVKNLVKKTLEKLYQLQTKTSDKVDYTKTFEYEEYDEIPILHDLNYFKFLFVDVLGIHYHKSTLLKEFKKLSKLIENLEPKGLMIRDFQARNIMVSDEGEVSFIDYQSAMKGPLMYDVVSFLFQAKANFPENFKEEMLDYYCSLWNDENLSQKLKSSVKPLQLIRFLQVLGAYGFRGLVQQKPHFIASIEKGVQNLSEFAEKWPQIEEYPELKNLISKLKSTNQK